LRTNSSPDIKIFLIGNKVDLEERRVISRDAGENLKDEYDFDLFMETSAKTGYNTKEIFNHVAILLYNDYSKYKKHNNNNEYKIQKLDLEKDIEENKICC